MSILKGINVTRQFGNSKKNTVYALKSVNVTFEEGSFTAIMGTSGSGKSTLLNIISGLDTPTEGTLFFNDIKLNELNDNELTDLRNKYYGFIFQFFHLIPVMNVMDNVLLPNYFSKNNENDEILKERALQILKELNINHLSKSFPSELSGGQQQRVAIARALINNPDILLADEPTGSLDSNTSKLVMEQLKKLNIQKKQTVIIVTHDATVAAYADRVLLMHDGCVVEDELLTGIEGQEKKVRYLSNLLNDMGRK